MRKASVVSFCLVFSLIIMTFSLSSCFFKGSSAQKILLYLNSSPYDGVSIKMNGARYETNTQCSVSPNNAVILQVDQSKAYDMSVRVGGDDTRLVFDHWSSGETDSIIAFIPVKSATYTAHFAVEYYVSLESSATSARSGSDPSGWYASGTQLQLSAPTVAGKDFLRWLVNGENAGNANPLVLTVDNPKAVVAVYELMKQPPSSFATLYPTNGATQVNHEPYVQFLWNASVDPQDSAVYYNLYFGENATAMEIVGSGISETFFRIYTLVGSKTYFWKVEAINAYGLKTSSSLNSFSTGAFPPSKPQPVYPRDGEVDVPYSFTLEWACNGAARYDLHYWITGVATTVIENIQEKRHQVSYLEQGVTYNWMIVAYNALGSAQSDIWQFTVTESAVPPSLAHTPSPRNLAINQELAVTLSWGQPVVGAKPFTYDVYFGVAPVDGMEPRSLRKILSDSPNTSVNVEDLDPGTNYIWQVISKNPWGVSASLIWTFMTQVGMPKPTEPSNPIPALGATGVPTDTTLSWAPSLNGTVTYDLYLGTVPQNMQKVGQNLPSPTFELENLALSTTYYWKVNAWNESGSRESELWSFKTTEDMTGLFLVKIDADTFVIRANQYFPIEDAVMFTFDSSLECCYNLIISPIPSSKISPEKEVICNYHNAHSSFDHFSPTNTTLATITCSMDGTYELVSFYNGSDVIPIIVPTVALP